MCMHVQETEKDCDGQLACGIHAKMGKHDCVCLLLDRTQLLLSFTCPHYSKAVNFFPQHSYAICVHFCMGRPCL